MAASNYLLRPAGSASINQEMKGTKEDQENCPASSQKDVALDPSPGQSTSQARNAHTCPPKRDRHTTSKPAAQLRFITTTNPQKGRDARSRKIVRSHVARYHHIVRQQAWRGEDEAQGTTTTRESVVGQASNALTVGRQSRQVIRRSSEGLITAVGPGGTDPFDSASLEMTPRINVLVDHCERPFFLAVQAQKPISSSQA
jgi:hypothetical protein